MLALCILPTDAMQLRARGCGRWISASLYGLTAFMIIARLFSGVHWLTDIIGGLLLSSGLVMLYKAMTEQ